MTYCFSYATKKKTDFAYRFNMVGLSPVARHAAPFMDTKTIFRRFTQKNRPAGFA